MQAFNALHNMAAQPTQSNMMGLLNTLSGMQSKNYNNYDSD